MATVTKTIGTVVVLQPVMGGDLLYDSGGVTRSLNTCLTHIDNSIP